MPAPMPLPAPVTIATRPSSRNRRGSRAHSSRRDRGRTLASSPHGRCGEGDPTACRRCAWGASTPDYAAYHDDEWGRPVVDDTRVYEKLCLEGFQSGLSWLTILRKRENFPPRVRGLRCRAASRGSRRTDVQRLLQDAGIVRHRGKIEATIANARATSIAVEEEHGSLAALVLVVRAEGSPQSAARVRRHPGDRTRVEGVLEGAARYRIPLRRPDDGLRRRCSRSGIVNDHLVGCDARAACEAARKVMPRPAPFRSPLTISAASGSTIGEKRAMTSPSRPTRNFSKFQRMSPVWPSASAVGVSCWYSAWRPSPLTSIFSVSGNVTL